jgi:hypothetical protein
VKSRKRSIASAFPSFGTDRDEAQEPARKVGGLRGGGGRDANGLVGLDALFVFLLSAATIAIFVFGLMLQRRREYVILRPRACDYGSCTCSCLPRLRS